MRCLVTGAAGFIGSHLCEALIADGHIVHGLDDLSNGKLSNLDSLKSNPNFRFIGADITKMQQNFCAEIDWVFHLAAKADIVPSIEFPKRYHHTNVTGTIELLEMARSAGVRRFIYAASSSCYGIPDNYPTSEIDEIRPQYPYALTKRMGEEYVLHWSKVYGLPALSLRLFNVYGPRHRTAGTYGAVFGTFLAQLANGQPLTVVGDGKQRRDFTFVTDVCDAFIVAAKSKISGRAINIGTGDPRSVNQLVNLLGADRHIEIPDRPGEPKETNASIMYAVEYLGWKPKVSFEEGVNTMRGHIPEYKDAPLWDKAKIEKATESWFKYLGG